MAQDPQPPAEPEADAPAPAGEPAPPPAVAEGPPGTPAGAPKCTAAFRRGLLARLPQLGAPDWAVKDSFTLDDDWNTAVRATADSILGPLEPIAAARPATDPHPPSGSS